MTDVAPRDGLQNEPNLIPTADKVRLIELLARAGVNEIEATSFVSPKWIPQLSDAAEVLAAVAQLNLPNPPVFSALVPNEHGMDRALHIHSDSFPLKIAVFTAASETFSQKNTNTTVAGSIARFGAFLPRAFDAGMSVRMYISCVARCPFDGPTDPDFVRQIADDLLALAPAGAIEAGCVEIDLGDTIGVAYPDDIKSLLIRFEDEIARDMFVLHLHDTFGRAADCAELALALGVRSFDSSVAGLGGCPYAGTPEKPAPGNIATDVLLNTIESSGYTTTINKDALAQATSFAQELLACPRVEPAE